MPEAQHSKGICTGWRSRAEAAFSLNKCAKQDAVCLCLSIVLPRPFVQWQLSLSCKSLCGWSTHQEVSPTDAQGALSKGSLRRAGTKERNHEDLSLPEGGMKEAWWSHHEEHHILHTRLCGHLQHISVCKNCEKWLYFPFLDLYMLLVLP